MKCQSCKKTPCICCKTCSTPDCGGCCTRCRQKTNSCDCCKKCQLTKANCNCPSEVQASAKTSQLPIFSTMPSIEPPDMSILKDRSQLEFYILALERWATIAKVSGMAVKLWQIRIYMFSVTSVQNVLVLNIYTLFL